MDFNRSISNGCNAWCGVSREGIASLSPDLNKLQSVKVDDRTTVYFDPQKRTSEEAIDRIINPEKYRKNEK